MNQYFLKTNAACLLAAALLASCGKDKAEDPQGDGALHKIAIATAINTGTTPVGYIGTLPDFSAGSYTNAKARQTVNGTTAPIIYGGDLYVAEGLDGNNLIKYTRRADGTLDETGRLALPTGSRPLSTAFQSAEKAYITLNLVGKIVIFDPRTMEKTGEIDLTAHAIGDASPDPSAILYRAGKLYVACIQSSDGYTSMHPAQILVIDLADNNKVTSLTDPRTTTASDMHSWRSMFFDEKGDLYVLCLGSWGFVPGQKGGFLRVKKGEARFDPDYFLNATDYAIAGIPGGKLMHVYNLNYAGNGIVYATGNVAALTSNPPDYVNDRNFGAFRIDLYNKAIAKLDIPYSNGYAAAVLAYGGKVYFGMSAQSGVGVFSYDPSSGAASPGPVLSTQGDPRALEAFE